MGERHITVQSDEELLVATKAINEYRRVNSYTTREEEFLKTKQFPMGSYVIKKGTTYFDNVFNTGEGEIGKIVGWDFEYEYYRVYFSKNMPYMGVREEMLQSYTGKVSDELLNRDPYQINAIMVRL
jgi:hypothetical protein